ncbi:hypothetical protein CDL12_08546 [Handroanthus impetiginosus]|uniref:RING-type E3 ubiquitin transferase n=1 Tax=Handroanthus impetiginosus TaxID=429701 RepID=A0A2G9HMN3_9LAMI|nr:hypothetical protein CDL12_08546 [Handroanthus impetiginosus]
MSRISPTILLVIAILAIIFFLFGLLQLLARFLIKNRSFSSLSQSNSIQEAATASHTFQRQLQQLFRLQDSGLDKSLIDALPIFYYKEIMGLKEPFDCAICLCEFSASDKLKLLVGCSHAFHTHCIETWLLSNSTCPLCRSQITPEILDSIQQWKLSHQRRANESFYVRLGKFKRSNEGLENVGCSSNLDTRRCYSMGQFEYIVGEDDMHVSLHGENVEKMETKKRNRNEELAKNGEIDGKKISSRSRGDSLSVSKIWLWSKKGKFLSSFDANDSVVSPRSDLV